MLLNTACFTRFTRIGAPVLLFILLAFLSQRFYFSSLPLRGNPTAAGKLHIGVFATSGNYHLCQLHISAALMGYPAFTLINWQDPEDKDAMKQHAAKIEGAIRYIDSIPAEQQDELVFLVDGYDMWFQLPHEYILKRYHELVAEAHQRHIDEYGQALVAEHNIKTTVIFGPDKECAPGGMDAPGCWAVPESLMHPLAFGPETDHTKSTQSRPRWLNSGTIIGPAREIRDILIAAAEERRVAHVTDSDQYYFGVLYGMQSYARRLLRLHRDQSLGIDTVGDSAFLDASRPSSPSDKHFPNIANRKSDYSIGLDTNSAIFQTTGFYADYISWVRNNASSDYVRDAARKGNYHHHFAIQDDLRGRGPGQIVGVPNTALRRWETLPLATNTISRNVPAVMHINGKKGYRILWWPRMWFYPFLEQIWAHLKANSNMGRSTVAGQRRAIEGGHTLNQQGPGWIDWEDVCGKYEDRLMGKSREPN